MKKILIAYFSHEGENLVDDEIVTLKKGNTQIAAEELGSQLEAKGFKPLLFRIEEMIPYPYEYDATLARSRQEKEDGAMPLINDGPNNFELYDIIFLGFPNWWGTIPAPILSFLRGHDFSGKKVIPFITHGGQDFLYSLDTIKAELPGIEVIKGFACAAPYISSANHVIASFLEENKGILD
ncbi:MAG: flavodoxin [Bacilli bacterium]|nr:flavodoxin [Bacilli bacterium]